MRSRPSHAVLTILATSLIMSAPVRAGSFGGLDLPEQYVSGSEPDAVAVGSLDGDAHADFVAVNRGDGTLTGFRGDASGIFTAISSTSTGPDPQGVALGDFNGDGRDDAAVVGSGAGAELALHLNAGDGTFNEPITLALAGAAHIVRSADLNHDGAPDLVTADHIGMNLSILFGNGDGTFATVIALPLNYRPWALAIADVNGDMHLDLVLSGLDAPPFVSDVMIVLRNDGTGSFTLAEQVDVISSPVAVAVGDLNRDNVVDVSVVSSLGTVSIFHGIGDGTMTDGGSVFVNGRPSAMVAEDVNRDGFDDLVVVDRYLNRADVIINEGDGFAAVGHFDCGVNPVDVVTTDIDNDGDADLLIANSSTVVDVVTVLRNLTPQTGCARPLRLEVRTGELLIGSLAAVSSPGGEVAFVNSDFAASRSRFDHAGPQNRMELDYTARIDAGEQINQLHITIAGSALIAETRGEVWLMNQHTGRFERVATYDVPAAEIPILFENIPAARYATAGGRILLRLTHRAVLDDASPPFLSVIDHIEIAYD